MKRAQGILASLRLVNSLLLNRHSTTCSLHSQVTQYSNLSPCFYSCIQYPTTLKNDFLNTHQKSYLSTQPDSISDLFYTTKWSKDLQHKLEKSNQKITHGTVLYVLHQNKENPQNALDFFNWVCNNSGFKPTSTVYSLLLRILGCKESIDDFWDVMKKMEYQGFDLDEDTSSMLVGTFRNAKMKSDAAALSEKVKKIIQKSSIGDIVKKAVGIILESDWNEAVEKKLGEPNFFSSENNIIRVITELRRYPLKALEFFCWAGEKLGYEHNDVSYNAILKVLGQEESVEEFWRIVNEMKAAGHEMDIDAYLKVSRQFQRTNMIKDVVDLYEFMMDGPYKPSACSLLLRHLALSSSPDLSLVARIVKKYEATGHSLSKVDYDGIHRCLTSAGRLDEAKKILDTMRNAGCEPDNIAYSQMVFGLCKVGRLEEACNMLDEMEAQGCVPDSKTWAILIRGHCWADEVDKALKIFTNMLEENINVDADLVSILVNSLYSQKRLDAAYTVVTSVVEKANLKPLHATYKDLIEKLLEEGKFEEALKILCLMKKHYSPAFSDPFFDYISKCGTVDDAEAFLKVFTVKDNPRKSAYLRIFNSFLTKGRQSVAEDFLYKCPPHIRGDTDVLNLIFSFKGTSESTA